MASLATSIWLAFDLDLATPEIVETFNYGFPRANARNLESDTTHQNADSNNPSASFPSMCKGQAYDFCLQMGYVCHEEFLTLDLFHGPEGMLVKAEL